MVRLTLAWTWLGLWLPLSVASDLVDHIKRVGCIVQNLATKEVLINTMDLSLHRWWSADAIKAMEVVGDTRRAHLQQCSPAFAAASVNLFLAKDPVVGMWVESDDETSRDMYDVILDYLRKNDFKKLVFQDNNIT